MVRTVDIERMSYDQLQELSQKVEAAKKDRKSEGAKAVKQKISHLLKRSGFTISELYGITTGSKSSAKKSAAVKYRNPNDPSQTWTGRGRRPFWLVEALKKRGAKLDDFAA